MERSLEVKHQTSMTLKSELFARQKQLIRDLSSIFIIKRMEQPPILATSSSRASIVAATMSTTHHNKQQPQKFKILNSCIRMWPSSSLLSNTVSSNYDRENATAIGYIAQVVQMLATILGVPLRYPLVCRASKSYIIEHVGLVTGGGGGGGVGSGVASEPRMLALYRQTSAPEELFFYAVNLLNADIVQIRVLFDAAAHRNVDHSDPLVNLKWIFEFFNK